MTAPRSHVSLKTKLAATLLALGHIPHEEAKLLTPDEIVSRFNFDHYPIRHEAGGPAAPWNLVPRLCAEHSRRTNVDNGTGRSDRRDIARSRKIAGNHATFLESQAAKAGGEDPAVAAIRSLFPAKKRKARRKRKMRSRGFRKVHRPLQSRPSW